MKYGVWFVRLIYASWMIPAGLNHFYPLFPQPLGSQPLSQALILALIDSNLFDLVKAVELLAGICLLVGFYTPLALLACLPVSFCVFYYDAPLEGWTSGAATYGYAVLSCNVILCFAYYKHYISMFSKYMKSNEGSLVSAIRILFGVCMIISAGNFLFLHIFPMPQGENPLAEQLMSALVNSRLLDVALVVQLITGLAITSGRFVPAALSLLLPISSCALFWAIVLEQNLLYSILTFTAFSINGLLMLAKLSFYRDILQRRTLAIGEDEETFMNYDTLYVNPFASLPSKQFIPAMIILIAAILFFLYDGGSNADYCILVLQYPAFVLLAQRMRHVGYSVWLLLIPLILSLTSIFIFLKVISFGDVLDQGLIWLAITLFLGLSAFSAMVKRQG